MKSKLLDYLGGEELLEKSSIVYEALSNVTIIDNNEFTDCRANELKGDLKPGYLDTEEIYSYEDGIGFLQRISFLGKIRFVTIKSKLYNSVTNELLDEFVDYIENKNYFELAKLSTTLKSKDNNKNDLRLNSTFTWSIDGVSVYEAVKDFAVSHYENAQPYITELKVTAPRAKDKKMTIVLYDRQQFLGETTDYSYTGVLLPNNKTKVMMPFAGELRVDSQYFIKGINTTSELFGLPKLALVLEKEGQVNYGFDAKKFAEQFTISEDRKILSWKFNDDWNAILDLSLFDVRTIVDFSCYFTINLEKADGGNYYPTVSITSCSSPTQRDSGSIEIEKIQIQWGCVAKGTMINLTDNSQKLIEEIKINQKVLTNEGKSCTVTNILKGIEKSLVCLETANGHKLYMTDSHPVLTERGLLRADKLNATDVICTIDGNSQVKYLFTDYNEREVYNLEFDNQSLIYCNGIVAGDYYSQNNMAIENEILPEPTQLQLELRELIIKTKLNT